MSSYLTFLVAFVIEMLSDHVVYTDMSSLNIVNMIGYYKAESAGNELWIMNKEKLCSGKREEGLQFRCEHGFNLFVDMFSSGHHDLWIVTRRGSVISLNKRTIGGGIFFADVEMSDNEEWVSGTSDGSRLIVITSNRRIDFDIKSMHRTEVKLSRVFPALGGGSICARVPRDGSCLYVGIDAGEFGGGLWRINDHGSVSRVKLGRNEQSEPITAVAADTEIRPDCVLVASGLEHRGFSMGKVVRVCSKSNEVLYDEDALHGAREVPVVVRALVAYDAEVWASSSTMVYKIVNGSAVKKKLGKRRKVKDISLYEVTPSIDWLAGDVPHFWKH